MGNNFEKIIRTRKSGFGEGKPARSKANKPRRESHKRMWEI